MVVRARHQEFVPVVVHNSDFGRETKNYFKSCCASSLTAHQYYKRNTLIIGKVIDGTVCGEYSKRMTGGSRQGIHAV